MRRDGLVVEEVPDIGGKIGGRIVAAGLVLLERLGDDGFDVAAIGAVDGAETCGFFFANGTDRLVNLAADRIGRFGGEDFVEDDAQRVDVAAGVDFPGSPETCSGLI